MNSSQTAFNFAQIIAFLNNHPGGKNRSIHWEERLGAPDYLTARTTFDTQMEAEDWAAENLGETYRETAVYSDAFGYLAHDFKSFVFYCHFPKTVEQGVPSGV